MKHLTLLLILVIPLVVQAQLPRNSIDMGRGIYGNKDKSECGHIRPTISPVSPVGQCPCTLQDVVNNNYTVGFGGGNFGRIYMFEDYAQPGNFAVYEGDGPSVWFDYGAGSYKIVDIGYDPAAPAVNGYVHLSDHTNRQTILLDGDTARIRIADQTNPYVSSLTATGLTSSHDNQMPDDDGRLAINPIKADTSIFGLIDTGVILTYSVPISISSFAIYTVSGWTIGHVLSGGADIAILIQWTDPGGVVHNYEINDISAIQYISESAINIPVRPGSMIAIRTNFNVPSLSVNYDIGATITKVHKG